MTRTAIAWTALFWLLVPLPAFADSVTVPKTPNCTNCYDSIQEAIDTAPSTRTITVKSGSYGPLAIVKQESGNPDLGILEIIGTVDIPITGSGGQPAIRISSPNWRTHRLTVRLSNLTISGGLGAGIDCSDWGRWLRS